MSETTNSSAGRSGRALGAGILGLFLLLPFLWRLERASFHMDETGWVLASNRVVSQSFLQRDSTGPNLPGEGSHYGWPNPPVGKYLMGAAIRSRIETPEISLSGTQWPTYDRPIIANIASRQIPPLEILTAARLPMAVLGAATCLTVFFLGRLAWGTRAGLLATCLLALNALMLTSSRRAMVDSPAIFFSSFSILLAALLIERRTNLQTSSAKPGSSDVGRMFGLGLVLGLALASKLNALVAAVVCVASLVLIPSGRERLRLAVAATVILIVAAVTFIAVNPFLYENPLSGSWSMLTFAYYEPGIEELAARGWFVFRRLFLGETDPQGLTYLTVHSWTGLPLEWVALPFGLGLALTGLLKRREAGMRAMRPRSERVILLWWVVSVAGITSWLPQDWERYYLPALPPTVLLVARGFDAAFSMLTVRLRRARVALPFTGTP
jgi:4-amino-4-deoxy-L-arabinose transferase-like glycosyltransferase